MKNMSFLFLLGSLASLTLFSCHPRDPKVLQDHEIRGASSAGRGFSNNRNSTQGSANFKVDWADRFDQVSTTLVAAEMDRVTYLPKVIDEMVEQYKALKHDPCLTQIQWEESPFETVVKGRLQLANCQLEIGQGMIGDGQVEFIKKIGADQQVHYQFKTLTDDKLVLKVKLGQQLRDVIVTYNFIILKNESASYIQQARVNYRIQDRFQNTQDLAIVINGQFSEGQVRLTAAADYQAVSSAGEKVAYFDSKLALASQVNPLESKSLNSFDWCAPTDQQYSYDFNYKAPMKRTGAQLIRRGYDYEVKSRSAKDQTIVFNYRTYCQGSKSDSVTHSILMNPHVQGIFGKL